MKCVEAHTSRVSIVLAGRGGAGPDAVEGRVGRGHRAHPSPPVYSSYLDWLRLIPSTGTMWGRYFTMLGSYMQNLLASQRVSHRNAKILALVLTLIDLRGGAVRATRPAKAT